MTTDDPLAHADRRREAYLARVRALRAADWGRLDAIGARLADNTPWARWRRAAIDADRVPPVSRLVGREVAGASALVARAARDAGRWLAVAPAPDPLAPPRRPVHAPTDPRRPAPSPEWREALARHERWLAAVAEVRHAAREAPAAARSASRGAAAALVLEHGLHALLVHPWDAEAAARLYAPVEPVVPFAALDGAQPRLPPGSP